MLNAPYEDSELVSIEDIFSALAQLAEHINLELIAAIRAGNTNATIAQIHAANAILASLKAAKAHGGLDLRNVANRIFMFTHASRSTGEIYEIASQAPDRCSFPTKPEDVYACRAILESVSLGGATL